MKSLIPHIRYWLPLLLLATALPAAAEEPTPKQDSFLGLHWGMSPAETRAKLEIEDPFRAIRQFNGHRTRFEIDYVKGERLYQLRIVFDDEDKSGYFGYYKNELIPWLVSQYGNEASSLNDIGRYTTIWRTAESVIVASYYGKGFSIDEVEGELEDPQITLTFASKKLFAEAQALKDKQP